MVAELARKIETLQKQYDEYQASHKKEKQIENEMDVARAAALRSQRNIIAEMRRPTPGNPANHIPQEGLRGQVPKPGIPNDALTIEK